MPVLRALGILFLKMFFDSVFKGLKGTSVDDLEDFDDSLQRRIRKLRDSVGKNGVTEEEHHPALAIEMIVACLQLLPEDRCFVSSFLYFLRNICIVVLTSLCPYIMRSIPPSLYKYCFRNPGTLHSSFFIVCAYWSKTTSCGCRTLTGWAPATSDASSAGAAAYVFSPFYILVYYRSL